MDKRPIAIDGRYIQDHFPGIGRYTFNLTRALAEMAPQDHFVLFHNPVLPNSRYDLAALAVYPNLELVHLAIPTFSLAEQYRLPFAIRHSQFAILHSPYYIKPYWLPCSSVVTVYDLIPRLYPQYLPSSWSWLVFEIMMRLALRTAHRVLTISHSAADDLMRLFGVPAEKIAVTPLAADERFRPDADRRNYSLPEQYVLYFGINKPHKNLIRLIEAWSLLRSQSASRRNSQFAIRNSQFTIRNSQFAIHNSQLVIAGAWDPRYPQVKARVAELGLQDRVIFLGPVPDEDLPALYGGATLFVFPSLYEGFGLPVLEAMACGAPVVCSNTSSLPEVVGEAALLVDPLDVDALATAMGQALADEGLRQEMREEGLVQAAKFSWKETARQTLCVYRSLIPGH